MGAAVTAAKKRTARPKKRSAGSAKGSAASRRRIDRRGSAEAVSPGKLPGWAALSGSTVRTRKRRAVYTGFIDAISTRRFVFIVLAVAGACTLYVGHVHATQDLYAGVQQQRKLNHNLNLKYNRLKGEFDRMTGPAAVYGRARQLGLEEDVMYGPTISTK